MVHPVTAGVRALVDGIAVQHARDEARIEAASTLCDALLAVHGSSTPRRKR
jgi:hypothetical protein